jgi:hypothetical protein
MEKRYISVATRYQYPLCLPLPFIDISSARPLVGKVFAKTAQGIHSGVSLSSGIPILAADPALGSKSSFAVGHYKQMALPPWIYP